MVVGLISDFLFVREEEKRMIFEENLKKYNQAFLRMDEFYHEYAVKNGLSDCAFWILYIICEDGEGCSQKELCRKLSVSKQTIHSAIHKLERDEILFLKAGTGRDKNIYLTERGKRFVEEKIVKMIRIENRAFDDMGEEDAKELQRLTWCYANLLQKIYEAVEQEDNKSEHSDIRTF